MHLFQSNVCVYVCIFETTMFLVKFDRREKGQTSVLPVR